MEGVAFAMRSSRDALACGQSLSTGIRASLSTFLLKLANFEGSQYLKTLYS